VKELRPTHRLAVAGALLVAGLSLAGCQLTVTLNEAVLEANISEEIQSQTGLTVSAVECPGDRPLLAGDVFTCSATTTDGRVLEITVEQTDGQGNVEWEVTGETGP
jgi:hypothetical protein